LSYGSTAVIGGSGFLAVYLTGVIVASNQRSTRTVLYFHEGLAATAQAVLFLLLGMLVFPSELIDDLGSGVVVAGALLFLARPLAVVGVLAWSRTPIRRMAVISWGGLRGAVPVVLATIPFTAGHPDGALIFDVAFVVVVLSIAIQAPTVGILARCLGVVAEHPPAVRPEIVALDSQDADLIELTIPSGSTIDGVELQDVPLPEGARVSVIRRDEATLIPHGDTTLFRGDVLLLVASRSCELQRLEDWSSGVRERPSQDS
jgi:cell volume regulation protein A